MHGHGTEGHGTAMRLGRLGRWLDLIILEVLSSFNDSMFRTPVFQFDFPQHEFPHSFHFQLQLGWLFLRYGLNRQLKCNGKVTGTQFLSSCKILVGESCCKLNNQKNTPDSALN